MKEIRNNTKDFKNPYEYFITAGNSTKAADPTTGKEKAGAAMPESVETKSKRLNLLIKPSIFKALKEISHNNYTSVNNMINEILEQYITVYNEKGENKE